MLIGEIELRKVLHEHAEKLQLNIEFAREAGIDIDAYNSFIGDGAAVAFMTSPPNITVLDYAAVLTTGFQLGFRVAQMIQEINNGNSG